MDHHADRVLGDAHGRGGLGVEDLVDHLDLKKVVARAERAALVGAPGECPLADGVGIGPVEAAAGLGVLQVAVGDQALPS